MRTIPLLIAVSFGLAPAPAAAQFSPGPVGFKMDSDSSPWVKKPPEPEFKPRDRRKHRRSQRPFYPYAYPYYSPYYYYDDRDDYRDEAYEDEAPPPVPAPPETATPAEPPPPPDPKGPLNSMLARGAPLQPSEWEVGEPLPPRLPHVTLDWRRYELPEPEPGRLYARVGRDVLVITAADRVVERVLPGD